MYASTSTNIMPTPTSSPPTKQQVSQEVSQSPFDSFDFDDELPGIIDYDRHGHGHSHGIGGGHDSSSESDDGQIEGKNVNVQAAYLHVLGDMLMSIGVCIAATVIFFFPEW